MLKKLIYALFFPFAGRTEKRLAMILDDVTHPEARRAAILEILKLDARSGVGFVAKAVFMKSWEERNWLIDLKLTETEAEEMFTEQQLRKLGFHKWADRKAAHFPILANAPIPVY